MIIDFLYFIFFYLFVTKKNVQLDDRLMEGGEEFRAGRQCFRWASSVILGWASLTAKEHGIAALPVALIFDVTTSTYIKSVFPSSFSMSLIPSLCVCVYSPPPPLKWNFFHHRIRNGFRFNSSVFFETQLEV